jgi:tRNA (pseudouridine54-N1)-methyltransferase
MRTFIYYSRTAPTTGKFSIDNLQKAGRIDIAIHTIISTFFLSHRIRKDARLHLIFAGPPDPPKHIEMAPVVEGKTGIDKIYISKTNIAPILKKILYKYREGEKREVFPGYWIEKKGFLELINEISSENKNLYVLDQKGEDIRFVDVGENPVFILGDHKGLPHKELRRLKKICTPVSLGKRTYFASQAISIVNYELDRREDSKYNIET